MIALIAGQDLVNYALRACFQEKRDAVRDDGGVVLGDYFLLEDADHLLHHVHLSDTTWS